MLKKNLKMMSQTIDETVKTNGKNGIAYQPILKEKDQQTKEQKIKLWNSLDGSSHSLSRKENKRYDCGSGDMDDDPQEKPLVKS